MKSIHFVRGYTWPPSLFNQPRGNSLGARLNFIMIPLKMAERSSISCDPSRYRNRVDIRYALFQNSQGKSALYFIKFISTEKWVGCKHFKSYIFEVFADKHGQVAGDSMTRSCRSCGGSQLLMKALLSVPNTLISETKIYNLFTCTPLSKMTSITATFIWESIPPTPLEYLARDQFLNFV